MQATEIKMLRNMELEDQEYVVNGVRYIVASRFQKFHPKKEQPVFLKDRLEHYLAVHSAKLTEKADHSNMISECVCAAVGKEAYAAEQEKG